jgi:hypothetical protein
MQRSFINELASYVEAAMSHYSSLSVRDAIQLCLDEGKVDFSNPDYEEWRVDSSCVDSIGYNNRTNSLVINFKQNRQYIYSGVPREIYENLLEAPSHGRFVNGNKRVTSHTKSLRKAYGQLRMDDTVMTQDELVEYVLIRDLLYGEPGLHYNPHNRHIHELRGRYIELAHRWRRYEKSLKERFEAKKRFDSTHEV